MRTIIDLPEPDVSALDAQTKRLGISRAEAVRRAVAQYLATLQTPTPVAPAQNVFGLWADRADVGDALDYERRLRDEWPQR